jgi:hypothetical protein
MAKQTSWSIRAAAAAISVDSLLIATYRSVGKYFIDAVRS